MPVPVEKVRMRKQYMTVRKTIPASFVLSASRNIAAHTEKYFDWPKINWLHTYLPIAGKNEVDTWQIIKWIWQQHPHINIAVPQLSGEEKVNFQSVKLEQNSKLNKNWLGIDEPEGPTLEKINFGLIFVPVVAFDLLGNRLGFGGGYYDRFLGSQNESTKVGLAYDDCRAEKIPAQTHDVKLDIVITESGLAMPV